jgi:hypothetical protein
MSSFEPKNKQQYYCISALPVKNSQIKKRMQIATLEDK